MPCVGGSFVLASSTRNTHFSFVGQLKIALCPADAFHESFNPYSPCCTWFVETATAVAALLVEDASHGSTNSHRWNGSSHIPSKPKFQK
ncbi:MAG: hypothetical protein BWY59_00805 [Verrucomicrobia bacterium ADurb.Bin345]|nr:MAG: hypothetical protein BWY59_00805 [Verrucomicrobia bacterium ADurb.Bin345]